MNVLALGCGEMGKAAIKDLVEYGDFDEVVVGDINLERAENFVKKLKSEKTKVSAKFVDVTNSEKLVDLMSNFDVALSCVGPFYKFALPVVKGGTCADAGYGLILLFLSLFGYFKLGKHSEMFRSWSFMGIWMGLVTTVVGFLTYSIFGNFFHKRH